MTLSPTDMFVIAWITPMGIVNTNAGRMDVSRQANIQDSLADAPMRRASTKAQTGNYVSHTSMTIIPNKNMVTAKEVSIQTCLTSILNS
jgi:hypothetical protein